MLIENDSPTEIIDSASNGIKFIFFKEGKDIPESLTHEIIASYFGVESVEDVKDIIEGGDPAQFNSEDRERNVSAKIASIDKLTLNGNVDDIVVDFLDVELTPHCSFCGCAESHTIAVISEKQNVDQAWVCQECLKEEDATAVKCQLCSDEFAYPADEVDDNGLCPEHKGEFDDGDEDDIADRESYEEYQLEHSDN